MPDVPSVHASVDSSLNVSAQYGGLPTFQRIGRLYNAEKATVYYTDGACSGNGQSGGSAPLSGCGVFGGSAVQLSRRCPASVSLLQFSFLFDDSLPFSARSQVQY